MSQQPLQVQAHGEKFHARDDRLLASTILFFGWDVSSVG